MRHRTFAAITLMGALLLLPSSAAGQAPQDSVTADGAFAFPFSHITIDARSGPSGENPTGSVSYGIPCAVRLCPGGFSPLAGTLVCLNVTSNTATMVITSVQFAFHKIEVGDNAGKGQPDTFAPAGIFDTDPGCAPTNLTGRAVTQGDISVVDAPPLPTTKDQCKDGGWRAFGSTFKNQGQCVASAERPSRASP